MRWIIAIVCAIALLLLSGSAAPALADECTGCDELEREIDRARATALASASQPAPAKATIYFFWGDGCPHCAEQKPFLDRLARSYPGLEVRAFEVWYVKENRDLFMKMAAAYGFEARGVPTTFLGKEHWVGFNESAARQMEAAVQRCMATSCPDAGEGIVSQSAPAATGPAPAAPPAAAAAAPAAPGAGQAATASGVLTLPLIGAVDLGAQSLVASTALIAFVDGFNPCSLWVLSILLSLALHTGSRKKVFLIGFVFITVTAFVYMLFIAGLFTVFSVISFLGWVQVLVAMIALFFAVVNIKDYFWYQEGVSFTISDDKKPGIYARMRRVVQAGNSTWGLIGATVALAAGVSIVEFSCTAGFPVIWTNLLIAQGAGALTFVLLLGLYMLIYQLDELAIFGAAVFTLKSGKLEEKHGRILKLIGGTLMLTLAVVMLVNPALMNNLSSSLIIFGIAFAAALLVLLVHRLVLPRFGVRIGTEMNRPEARRGRKRAGKRAGNAA
jgi:thiol-disulfide isomerase/thioredoxin